VVLTCISAHHTTSLKGIPPTLDCHLSTPTMQLRTTRGGSRLFFNACSRTSFKPMNSPPKEGGAKQQCSDFSEVLHPRDDEKKQPCILSSPSQLLVLWCPVLRLERPYSGGSFALYLIPARLWTMVSEQPAIRTTQRRIDNSCSCSSREVSLL
jgi:hypothetical protein